MNKRLGKRLLICSPLLVLLCAVLGIWLNNFGCNYEMTMQTSGIFYKGVCRWGHVSFVEEELATHEKWRVSGWQLNVGNQLAYLITHRQQLSAGNSDKSVLNNYNQIQSDFTLVNYAWLPLTENKIAIFQRAPHHDILVAEREGWLDLHRWFFPPKPLLANEPSTK